MKYIWSYFHSVYDKPAIFASVISHYAEVHMRIACNITTSSSLWGRQVHPWGWGWCLGGDFRSGMLRGGSVGSGVGGWGGGVCVCVGGCQCYTTLNVSSANPHHYIHYSHYHVRLERLYVLALLAT